MQKSLEAPGLTDVSKHALTYNIDHYQIVNAARELAAFTFSFDKNFATEEAQDRLIALSEFLLLPSQNISNEVTEKYSKENKLSIEDSFSRLTKEKMAKEKELILSAISELTEVQDSQSLEKLDSYLTRYLTLKYTDANLTQTNYLGRAIVSSFVRYLRKKDLDNVERKMRREFRRHVIFLDNYISDKLTIVDNQNKAQNVILHAGDFANEYSKGSEAYYISIGTAPKGFTHRIKATSNHLLGNAFKIAIYPTPDQEEAILKKVQAKENLSSMEKIQYSLLQSKSDIPGYSHAGMVDLKGDAESGIKMSWIWDSYPNDDIGGIRFIGPEGFVFPGEFKKVGFVHYSAEKFLNYYQTQIKTRGYLKNVWASYSSKIEDGYVAIDDMKSRYFWPAHITEAEMRSYANVDIKDAKEWFRKEIAPRVTGMMEYYFTSTEAIGFANGFNNVRGAAYCSQAIVLAYLQGADIDPEVQQDRLSAIVHIGHALKMSELVDIDLTQRVVSPSGFAWQTELVETHVPIMIQQDQNEMDTTTNVSIIANHIDDNTKNYVEQLKLNKFNELQISLPAID